MGYSKDAENNETYVVVGNTATVEENRYARDKDGKPYYPKDGSNNEFKPPSLQDYITINGEVVLPLNAQGKPIYPKDPNNANLEVYPVINGKKILGKGMDGHQYYAQNNSDEYYPDDGTIGFYNDGIKRYATGSNSETIFPKDSQNNEYYLMEVNIYDLRTVPSKYAKDKDSNEIYPKRITSDGYLSDCILTDAFARNKSNAYYYPKDAFDNEFYLPEKKANASDRPVAEMCIPTRYAQTNDAKILLPVKNNSVSRNTSNAFPAVANAEIVGPIIREGNQASDYLTKKDGDTSLKSSKPIDYRYRDQRNLIKKTNFQNAVAPKTQKSAIAIAVCPALSTVSTPFYKTWSFWILITVSLMIKSLAIWCFFFRNKISFINTR